MQSTDLRFKFTFDLTSTPTVTITDELGTAGYTALGVTPGDVQVLLRLDDPTGTIYLNSGFSLSSPDFTSPDIDGSSSWDASAITLTLDDTAPITGAYTLYYVVSTDGGSTMDTYVTKAITFDYVSPTVSMSLASNCTTSTIAFTDSTSYDVNHVSDTITPTATRTLIYRPPVYTAVAAQTVNPDGTTYTVTPNIYRGNYDFNLNTALSYEVEDWSDDTALIRVTDNVEGESSLNVLCDDISSCYYSCVKAIDDLYTTAKTESFKEADRLQKVRHNINFYYTLYKMTLVAGGDTDYSAAKLRELINNEVTCDTLTTIGEVIPTADWTGSSGGSGTIWYSGTGAPGGEMGTDGDFYFKESGVVYKKTSGTWTEVFTLASSDPTIAVKTANYTLVNTDDIIEIDASSSSVTISATAGGNYTPGRSFVIKLTSLSAGNTVTFNPTGLVEGASTYTFASEGDSITVYTNGTNWRIS